MESENSVKPWMFRVSGEGMALLVSVVITLIVGWVFSLWSFWFLVGFVIFGLFYVRLQQAQFLGNGVRVHKTQFPEIYSVFSEYAKRLGIRHASLYAVQDPYIQAFTIGINRCTVVVNSALIEQLNEKEWSFVIGHELGHFAAGHTKISTVISPMGGNVITNFLFSFWNRKTEYTCDRCGLVLTRDLDAAISALIKVAVGGKLFSKLDFQGYISQLVKAEGKSVSAGELLISHPLITNRIKALYVFWKENFVKYKQEIKE